MAEIIVASTIVGNAILCLLMLYRGWTGRLQWFAGMTGLAVLVDFFFYFLHALNHIHYAPLRIFTIYWLFPILELLCAWEAAMIGMKWLEYLMLLQVALAAGALAAHLHHDIWAIYYLEWFAIWINLGGILLSIYKLHGEVTYEPSQAS